jgi:hypothetical protein
MKKVIAICFLFLLACTSNTKKEKSIKLETPTIIKADKVDKTDKVEVEEIIDNTLIAIKKEACTGDCPEFEVKISKDSILNYKGINYVSIVGEHQLKLSKKQYNTLKELLKVAESNEFKGSYIDSTKTFLSKTLITFENQTINVNLWKDVPDPLINLYTFVEDLLYKQKYLEE